MEIQIKKQGTYLIDVVQVNQTASDYKQTIETQRSISDEPEPKLFSKALVEKAKKIPEIKTDRKLKNTWKLPKKLVGRQVSLKKMDF